MLIWVFGILWLRALNMKLVSPKSQKFIFRVLFQMFYWKYFFSSRHYMEGSFFYLNSLVSCLSHLSLQIQSRNLNYYYIIVSKEKPPKGAIVWIMSVCHLPFFHSGHIAALSLEYLMAFLEA